MDKEIKKIKLFVNQDDNSQEVANNLKKELEDNNFLIVDNDYDLAISIGGDGSFLRMVRNNLFNDNIYYIGVNAGTLGFLQEIDVNDTINFVNRLKNHDYKIEELNIEESTIDANDKKYVFNSLNEIVIRKKNFSILKTDIYIDDELLEHFSGDGLLISTSTGSTAYNMSFGGSIVYNTLNTLQLTPIAPLNNQAYRTLVNSLIVPVDKKITFINNNVDIFLMIDGKIKEIDEVSKIEVKISSKKIKCLRMNDFHFIKIVNNKIIDK